MGAMNQIQIGVRVMTDAQSEELTGIQNAIGAAFSDGWCDEVETACAICDEIQNNQISASKLEAAYAAIGRQVYQLSKRAA